MRPKWRVAIAAPPTQQHEPERQPGADRGVVPVEPCGDDLRLADRPRLRPHELDLVTRGALRLRPDDLDLISTRECVVVRHRARHAVVGGHEALAGRARLLDADELDLVDRSGLRLRPDDLNVIAACQRVVARHRARHAVVAGVDDLLTGRGALVHLRLRDRSCERRDRETEGDPLDQPVPSPIGAHLCAPFLRPLLSLAHQTAGNELFFHR